MNDYDSLYFENDRMRLGAFNIPIKDIPVLGALIPVVFHQLKLMPFMVEVCDTCNVLHIAGMSPRFAATIERNDETNGAFMLTDAPLYDIGFRQCDDGLQVLVRPSDATKGAH